MPSICDPGEELIRIVKSNKKRVICIPGPCAAITALVSSGFPSSKFTFEGFFPKKSSERKKLLLEINENDRRKLHSFPPKPSINKPKIVGFIGLD